MSVTTRTAASREAAPPAPAAEPLPDVPDPRAVAPKDARDLTRQFLRRLEALEEGTAEFQYVRNTLIEMNLSLVRYVAARFRGSRSAEEREDIVQVGTIGLIKAIDRYEVSRDVEFTTLAVPYVAGEIKRFFRDTTWDVRVPRRLQELRGELARANEALLAELGREPAVPELAAHLGISEAEVVEGQVAANGYHASSLDVGVGDDEGDSPLSSFIGARDTDLDLVEDLHALRPLLASLPERDRRIIEMRFGREMTQSEIGEELGVTQMHVSRLLNRCLAHLRERMLQTD